MELPREHRPNARISANLSFSMAQRQARTIAGLFINIIKEG
jgi:hypothetical protein